MATYYSNSSRRKVFYAYPQGAFPLMGLLSLMDEGEQLDKDTFGWFEDRHTFAKTTTAIAIADGPFTDTTGVDGAVGANLTVAGWTAAAPTVIRIKVTDASVFRTRDLIWIKDVAGTASSVKQVRGIVDVLWASQNTIDVRLLATVTNALNGTTQNGMTIASYGTASVAGGYSKVGGCTFPVELSNFTQIMRTVVGPFDANVLKAGLKFDSTGIYSHYAKKAKLLHMEKMEWAAYFGIRNSSTVTDPDDNVSKIEKLTGGLYYYLQQYELGNVSNGGLFEYRPGGTDLTASAFTVDDPNKRICAINGSITGEQFETLIERAFFYNGDQSWEKLFICGQGLLSVFNKYARQNSIKVVELNDKEDTYGMQVTQWETAFGNIYFKTHPLFTNNPVFRYSGFIVDMSSVMYHSRDSRDTVLLKNRQANDFDGRKDEWLTEFGLEWNFPERHMYIEGLTGITV